MLSLEHDLFRPAFARRSIKPNDGRAKGFAQAGNRFPLFGIMLCHRDFAGSSRARQWPPCDFRRYPLDGSARAMPQQRATPRGGYPMTTIPAESTDRSAHWHDVVALVARLAMGWIFLSSGFTKLTDVALFSANLAKRGVPAPSLMGWLGAIVEFGGSLLIIFGFKIRYGAVLMILFVIVATLISHRYWEFTGADLIAQRTNFWKNVTIIGGLLFMFLAGAGRYSVDGFKK
jgi:putative oxidoreductase